MISSSIKILELVDFVKIIGFKPDLPVGKYQQYIFDVFADKKNGKTQDIKN
jgi:hypothetical protein